jgi:hypothetical protein
MPLRFYDNNDWRSPTSIRIYDNSAWQDATVGYVYDLGAWKVVFPDPITPQVTLSDGPDPTSSSVSIQVDTVNADYIIAELYLGTTQSNLLQSQTINTNNITDSEFIVFSGLSGNTTYNIKVTAYSITETTAVLLTGSFSTAPPVSLTATPDGIDSVTVSWTTTNQSRWRVIIRRTSTGTEIYRSSLDLESGTTNSITAFVSMLANTQYTVQLDLRFVGGAVTTEYTNFTTPNIVQPTITSITGTSTCNSITASWSGTNYVTASISLWNAIFDSGSNKWEKSGTSPISGPINYNTATTSHLFTGLTTQNIYILYLVLTSSTGQTVDSTTFLGGEERIVGTADPSVNTPTNFSASSDYHGILASFSWTAATANCTTVTGYRIEYKLNTDSTWAILSDSIAANATTFSAGGIGTSTFLPGRTYNFRIYAKSNFILSPVSSAINLTMNNNPYNISISGTSTITTFSSSTLTAQIRNAAYENISASGFTISWSFVGGINPPSGSSISPASSVTDSSGQATATFTSGSDDGTGTVYATTPNLGPLEGGQRVMTVILSTGLTPSLTGSGTTKGASFTNTNHNVSYSYTNTPGYPTVGSLEAGDSYNNSQFDILISRTRDARPTVSKSGNTATTTNTTFLANPLVSMAVRSSRTGYTTVDSPVAAITAGVTINTTRSYQWQQSLDGGSTWSSSFNANFSNTTSQTMSWTSGINSRLLRCQVTTNFSNGESETSTSTNTVTAP